MWCLVLQCIVLYCFVFYVSLTCLEPGVCPKDWDLAVTSAHTLFEHLSLGQALRPPTKWTTPLCRPCYDGPFWPRNHCMCVTARRLGSLHWLAHAAGNGHVVGLHILAHSKSTIVSLRKLCLKVRVGLVFYALRGAVTMQPYK